MTGHARFAPDSYADDIRVLRRRGLSADRIAKQLGMSRATVYRILNRSRTLG